MFLLVPNTTCPVSLTMHSYFLPGRWPFWIDPIHCFHLSWLNPEGKVLPVRSSLARFFFSSHFPWHLLLDWLFCTCHGGFLFSRVLSVLKDQFSGLNALGEARFLAFVHFGSVNIRTVVDFSLTVWCDVIECGFRNRHGAIGFLPPVSVVGSQSLWVLSQNSGLAVLPSQLKSKPQWAQCWLHIGNTGSGEPMVHVTFLQRFWLHGCMKYLKHFLGECNIQAGGGGESERGYFIPLLLEVWSLDQEY